MFTTIRDWRLSVAARRAGRKDGARGIPQLDEPTRPFALDRLVDLGRASLARVQRRWGRRDERLKGRWAAADHAVRSTGVRLRALEETATDETIRLETEAREDEKRLAEMQDRWAAEDGRAPTTSASAERTEPNPTRTAPAPLPAPTPFEARPYSSQGKRAGLNGFAYWLFITAFVIGEVPLNAFAFRLFAESQVSTYAVTFVVALLFVVLAHGLGIFLARAELTRRERVFVGLLVVVPLAAIAAISMVRYRYLVDKGADYLGPVLATMAFAALNLLLLGGATVLSYLRHDPDSTNYQAALATKQQRVEWRIVSRGERRVRRRQLRYERIERRRQAKFRGDTEGTEDRRRRKAASLVSQAHEQIQRSRAAEMQPLLARAKERTSAQHAAARSLDATRKQLAQAESRLTIARARRERWFAGMRAAAEQRRSFFGGLLKAYCAANIRKREDHRVPVSFEDLPEIPAALEGGLRWD